MEFNEILSNPKKREAYYNDYILRTQKKGNHQTTSNSQETKKTQNAHNTNTQNSSNNQTTQKQEKQNENISFDDIVENYKKDPNDRYVKRLMKHVLENITNSFREYATLVNDAYQKLYNSLNNKQMNQQEYESARNDLKTIISEQIKTITDFKIKYPVIKEFETTDQDLNQIIQEYQRKIKILSKKYTAAIKYGKKMYVEELKKYYIDNKLFVKEFIPRIQDTVQKFQILKSKIENCEISPSTKDGMSLLLNNFQKILQEIMNIADIRNMIHMDTSDLDALISCYQAIINEKMKEIKDLELSLIHI